MGHAAVTAGHKEAISAARSQFHSLMTDGTHVPANLQELVYSVGIKTGGEAEWNWCYQHYRNTNIPSDRGHLIKALGDTKDIFLLQRYLDMALNSTLVRARTSTPSLAQSLQTLQALFWHGGMFRGIGTPSFKNSILA